MGKQRKNRKLALLLFLTTLLSAVFSCWYEGDKLNAYETSYKETKTIDYFAEGFGTGVDFSEDSWAMKTSFLERGGGTGYYR